MTTTHFHTQPGLTANHGTRRPTQITPKIRFLLEKLQAAFTLWNNRRAIYMLARLEDRYLADIGVTRADVEWALAQPWHVDPSVALGNCLETRRGASRRARRPHAG